MKNMFKYVSMFSKQIGVNTEAQEEQIQQALEALKKETTLLDDSLHESVPHPDHIPQDQGV
jgi:hypothetical protein